MHPFNASGIFATMPFKRRMLEMASTMTVDKPIRVMVIDDYESIRTSLHQFLSIVPDLRWIGESTDGQDLLEQCQMLHPDVILIDVELPHFDAPATTRLIREKFPFIQVIGIVGFEDRDTQERLLKAGAAMCIPKTASLDRLAAAVRHAAIAQVVQSAQITQSPQSATRATAESSELSSRPGLCPHL